MLIAEMERAPQRKFLLEIDTGGWVTAQDNAKAQASQLANPPPAPM